MDMADKKMSGVNGSIQGTSQDTAQEFFPNTATVRAGLESARIGVWSWDAAANTLTWSINLESLHGLPPKSFNGTLAGFLDNIHGDDRANVEALLMEAMRALTPFRA